MRAYTHNIIIAITIIIVNNHFFPFKYKHPPKGIFGIHTQRMRTMSHIHTIAQHNDNTVAECACECGCAPPTLAPSQTHTHTDGGFVLYCDAGAATMHCAYLECDIVLCMQWSGGRFCWFWEKFVSYYTVSVLSNVLTSYAQTFLSITKLLNGTLPINCHSVFPFMLFHMNTVEKMFVKLRQ